MDSRFSTIDTSFGLSSGAPYGSGGISPILSAGSLKTSSDDELYNNLLKMFYNTSAIDYERALDLLNKENEFSANQAEINRLFQERMSNTAYQRQADDLRLAGYNPALILGGGGATTPSGSSASSNSVDVPNLLSALSSSFTSIFNNAMNVATTERGQNITAATTERGQNMKFFGDILKKVFSFLK